jgi:hypothetical protein
MALCASQGCSVKTINNGTPADAQAPDGGDDAQDDAGDDADAQAEAAPYPAFVPEVGKLIDNGGAKLTAPRVVTVTWSTDSNAAGAQMFDDALGASKYWKTAVSEYGIGPVKSDTSLHVSITTPPQSPWDDTEIETWMVDQISAMGSTWPQPDAQTVYVIYMPASVMVTSQGSDACNSYSGYHSEVTVGSDPHVAYALVLEACHDQATTAFDSATETAAHEIGEAATDPHTYSDVGLLGFDPEHFAWELWQTGQDEVGDACEFYDYAYYKEGADLPYWVQRLWSNASGAAGHDPCVPVRSEPYYSVTPLGLDSFRAVGQHMAQVTKGWHVPRGTTRTVQVGFYSDAPTSDWVMRAVEGDGMNKVTTPNLVLTLDSGTGGNGKVANLTIAAKSAPSVGNAVLVTMVSTKQGVDHYMPVIVGVY